MAEAGLELLTLLLPLSEGWDSKWAPPRQAVFAFLLSYLVCFRGVETGSRCATQAGLTPTTLQSWPPKCWIDRHTPSEATFPEQWC